MRTSSLGRIAALALLLRLAMASSSADVTTASNSSRVQANSILKAARSFDKFVAAVHQVETTGKTGVILGDSRRSLGPLQISQAAWLDALTFDPSIGGKYSDCKNLAYSIKVLRAYLTRHDPGAVKRADWEACARLWNSGPTWYLKTSLTNRYWSQVRSHLTRSANT
jgi:hypothetical protein